LINGVVCDQFGDRSDELCSAHYLLMKHLTIGSQDRQTALVSARIYCQNSRDCLLQLGQGLTPSGRRPHRRAPLALVFTA
jgi:hypothetical protein